MYWLRCMVFWIRVPFSSNLIGPCNIWSNAFSGSSGYRQVVFPYWYSWEIALLNVPLKQTSHLFIGIVKLFQWHQRTSSILAMCSINVPTFDHSHSVVKSSGKDPYGIIGSSSSIRYNIAILMSTQLIFNLKLLWKLMRRTNNGSNEGNV